MTAAGIVLACLLLPLALVDAVFLVETGLGLWRGHAPPPPVREKRVVVLVPAHDEAATLPRSGAALSGLRRPGTDVLLVADNCADDTAAIAWALGLEVVERHDSLRRGKGFALAFGRDRLAVSPPDVVVVLDADCEIEPDALSRLADVVLATDRTVQAAYVFRPAPQTPPVVQISNFAFMVKNLVRQRGIRRIGGAAILTGSGMAFPWRSFAQLELATGNIVEDLAIGISLVERGDAPSFYAGATVLSDCSSDAGSQTQRARWESGFLGMARQHAPGLLWSGLLGPDWRRFWMGLHLLVPPLSMLLGLNVAGAVFFGVAALLGAGTLPFLLSAALSLLLGLVVAFAWIVEGQTHLSRAAALRLPLYLAWKLAIYARIVTGRQAVAWTRTDRVDP